MDKLFQKIADHKFSDVRGLVAGASIPLPQELIDDILAVALQGDPNIKSCRVSIQAENIAVVQVRTKLLPWPFNLKLKIERSVDLASPHSPKLRGRLESHRLLGSLGSLFKLLPDGIQVHAGQLEVDLGAFMPPAQRKFLGLVKSLDIRTEEGRAILDLKVEVD